MIDLATSNFGSGLIGAVVGGVFSLIGVRLQSRHSLEAAKDERRALLQQDAAHRVVDALFAVKRLLRDLPPNQNPPLWVPWVREREDQLDRARSAASTLPDPFRSRIIADLRDIAAVHHPSSWDRRDLREQSKSFVDDANSCAEHFLNGLTCPPVHRMADIYRTNRERDRIEQEANEAEIARQLEAETPPEVYEE